MATENVSVVMQFFFERRTSKKYVEIFVICGGKNNRKKSISKFFGVKKTLYLLLLVNYVSKAY